MIIMEEKETKNIIMRFNDVFPLVAEYTKERISIYI